MSSATIFPDDRTPGIPAPGCVPAPAKYRLGTSSLAPVVRPEPSRLREDRFHGKRAAEVARQHITEMARVDHALRHDVLGEIRQVLCLEMRDDGVTIRPARRAPVGVAAKVWHRREHVEAVAARWRERRIGCRGAVQVQRVIGREHLAREDVVQQRLVPRAHEDLMMRGIAVRAVRAEVHHEERHRVLHPREPAIGVLPANGARNKVHVRTRDVAVAHDRIRRQRLAVREPYAGRTSGSRVDHDLFGRAIEPDFAAQLLEEPAECSNQRAGAPHCEPHTPALFQRVDQRVNGCALERVTAHQQRVEAEHLPETWIANVPVHERGNRSIGA